MPSTKPGPGAPKCLVPRCRARARVDLCDTHKAVVREMRALRGEFDLIDADPVRHHLGLLHRRGRGWVAIAREARMGRPTLMRIVQGQPEITREQAMRIVAIPAAWQRSYLIVPSVGGRRRLDALAWQGWPKYDIAAGIGVHVDTLNSITTSDNMRARVGADLAEFYDAHADTPGPSSLARARARNRGAIPAAAWTDSSIDDPDAQPIGMRPTTVNGNARRVHVDDIVHLVRLRLTFAEIAEKMGIAESTVRDAWSAAQHQSQEQEGVA